MKRIPTSLFAQTLVIVLGGLVVSNLAGSWIYSIDKEEAVRALGAHSAALRIVNVTMLVEETPAQWRDRIVEAVREPSFEVVLANAPMPGGEAQSRQPSSDALEAYLLDQGPMVVGRQPYAIISEPMHTQVSVQEALLVPRGEGYADSRLFEAASYRTLTVGMPLAGGQWLLFDTTIPDAGSGFSIQFLASLAIMALIMLGVSWWVVGRITTPLKSLASAASRLGQDLDAPPLQLAGSIEIQEAASAFNTMQARLRELVNSRTHVLASISHDLRTPLTLLRLRTENLKDDAERERMLANIADMESLVEATLTFAKEEADAEAPLPTDLTALIQRIADDLNDSGLVVEWAGGPAVTYVCRPARLRRALTNLIQNAANFGGGAHVSLSATAAVIVIAIEDDGPGIPEDQLERVFEPFYRLEASRSRETGGYGLGLAIAAAAVKEHNGEVKLTNRADGGLRAEVRLPRLPSGTTSTASVGHADIGGPISSDLAKVTA
jgi:signal transduction histidine kinase